MYTILPERVVPLKVAEYQGGPIVYWMNRECRAHDNWALLYAQKEALTHGVPLLVVYNLVPTFLGGGRRQYDFKVRGLREAANNLAEHNIPFHLIIDDTGSDTPDSILKFLDTHAAGMLVTDYMPLRICTQWNDAIRAQITIPFFGVDAHNIVPAWIVSLKQEFAAYTIRPKLHKLVPQFLDSFPRLRTMEAAVEFPVIDWEEVLQREGPDDEVGVVDWIEAGEAGAKEMLRHFLRARLDTYATDRNDPLGDNQSNLSPYLHYGHIAPQRVVLDTLAAVDRPITDLLDAKKNAAGIGRIDSAAAFVEELIVRRELADNFCRYNPEYDTVAAFPEWARNSLDAARTNEREYVYTQQQFENAQTHDDLWNAAQNEMRQTGKMHGYMRMYWAKKILEWTMSPEDALAIAIYLNDKYELDGRDPNGYAGIAWSIGGVHDRAWFPRPVFGLIRYMARSGCEKKFNVKAYIQKFNQTALF